MASATYSFLDIAVLDEVRQRLVDGQSLAILLPDLSEILWANASGARLFGHGDIEAAIGGQPKLGETALRQIRAAAGLPGAGKSRPVAIRLTRGLKSTIIQMEATGIALPDGETAVLFSQDIEGADQSAIARDLVSGFSEPGHFAAVLDEKGQVAAASDGFDALALPQAMLGSLMNEVRDEDDRLVKRRLAGGAGLYPAGLARIADEPLLGLLLVVDDGTPLPAPQPAPQSKEAEASSTETIPSAGDEAALPESEPENVDAGVAQPTKRRPAKRKPRRAQKRQALKNPMTRLSATWRTQWHHPPSWHRSSRRRNSACAAPSALPGAPMPRVVFRRYPMNFAKRWVKTPVT